MANLMSTAARWRDAGGNTPPAQWTGTAYEFLQGGEITLVGSAEAGDTLDFSALLPVGTPYYSHPLSVTIDGATQYTYDTSASPVPVSIQLSAGDAVVIRVMDDQSSYYGDVVLTPPPVPPPLTGVYGYHGRLKNIVVMAGSSLVVANQWAAETKKRGTTIASSTWTYSGAGTLTGDALTGTQATVMLTPTGCGVISNTVTLADGEVLVGTRFVSVG